MRLQRCAPSSNARDFALSSTQAWLGILVRRAARTPSRSLGVLPAVDAGLREALDETQATAATRRRRGYPGAVERVDDLAVQQRGRRGRDSG